MGELKTQLLVGLMIAAAIALVVFIRPWWNAPTIFGMAASDLLSLLLLCVAAIFVAESYLALLNHRTPRFFVLNFGPAILLLLATTHSRAVFIAGITVAAFGALASALTLARRGQVGGAR